MWSCTIIGPVTDQHGKGGHGLGAMGIRDPHDDHVGAAMIDGDGVGGVDVPGTAVGYDGFIIQAVVPLDVHFVPIRVRRGCGNVDRVAHHEGKTGAGGAGDGDCRSCVGRSGDIQFPEPPAVAGHTEHGAVRQNPQVIDGGCRKAASPALPAQPGVRGTVKTDVRSGIHDVLVSGIKADDLCIEGRQAL